MFMIALLAVMQIEMEIQEAHMQAKSWCPFLQNDSKDFLVPPRKRGINKSSESFWRQDQVYHFTISV